MTEHNIAVQPIVLSQSILPQLPSWIPPQYDGASAVDVYLQQCLPNYLERFSGVKKHIGTCFTESRHLEQTGWIDHINEMDSFFVATNQEKLNLEESGVTIPVHVIPMPVNFSTLDVTGELDGLASAIKGRYAFYFIGELIDRKNILDLLVTYWREFTLEDDVVLIIKTNVGNLPTEIAAEKVGQLINQIKGTVRMYDYPHHYPEVILMLEHLSDEKMVQLHNTCDCFITLSYGESTCRPLVDAAYKGKPIICTDGIGAVDPAIAISKIKSMEVPCVTSYPPIRFLYSSWETWMKPDILHAQHLMRQAYENKLPSSSLVNVKERFSYESVAARLNNIL